MIKKNSPIRKYITNEKYREVENKSANSLKLIMNECIGNFQDQCDCDKIETLKDILILLMKLVFDEDEVQISLGQRYINKDLKD